MNFKAGLLKKRVLELIEFDGAGRGESGGRGHIIHNKNLMLGAVTALHDVRIRGGGLNRVLTTGPNHTGPPEGGPVQPP